MIDVRENNVEFSLVSASKAKTVIPEPINYQEGNGNIYERDEESKGFLKTKSNNLEFYDTGYDFLLSQYATKGVAEDVILQKQIKSDDRLDERWRAVPDTYLDMGEAEFDDDRRVVKTKFTQGGIYQVLDSKKNDQFDILNTTSANGVNIGALSTIDIPLDGREIFLRSELTVEDGTLITTTGTLTARSIPFNDTINSDAEDITNVEGNQLSAAGGFYTDLSSDKVANCWYTRANKATTLKLNGRVEIRISSIGAGTLRMDLVRYNGDDLAFVEVVEALDTCNPGLPGDIAAFDFNDYDLDVNEGDSFAIGVLTDIAFGTSVGYEVYNTELIVEEDSIEPASTCKAVTEYEAGNRLVALITGQTDSFRCSFLKPGGTHEGKVLTDGYRVREFPDVINEGTDEERKIQWQTSLEDFIKHLDAREPIAWWVEKEGNKEVMRVETLRYTHQNFTAIKYSTFGQAKDVKRKTLKENFYSKIVLGSDKGGEDYEEVNGLQSISGKAEWSTINNKNEVVYSKLSPYRLGDVDVELARRKPFSKFPETDTRYDSDIMALDCKVVNGKYYLKKWQDVYEAAPTNIYRPDSAFNLEYTPARFLLNHSYVINVGLYHYSSESVRFNGSNCNSSFSSKKTGEDLLREDAAIPHSRLDTPTVRPKMVELTQQVEQRLEDQITGVTDGIPNWFGQIEVQTQFGLEYFRLIKVDANKEGKHKLIEAFQ